MPTLLHDTPTATSMEGQITSSANDGQTASQSQLGPGEQAASPYEEHMLDKTMGAVFKSLNDPKKIRIIETWLMKSQNLGVDIGHIAFKLLASIYAGAKSAGVQIPVDVFFAQGGAVYQTIDRILMIAEHAGVPGINQDQVREDALGIVVDSVKQMFGAQMQHGAQGQQQPGAPPSQQPPMLRANPLAHAVSQGLPQQSPQQQPGLMGAAA